MHRRMQSARTVRLSPHPASKDFAQSGMWRAITNFFENFFRRLTGSGEKNQQRAVGWPEKYSVQRV